MSIRAKILSIIVSALCLAFIVSALAYSHVGELDEKMGAILDQKLPAAEAARGIREDVQRVRDIELKMIKSDDASHLRGIEEVLVHIGKQIEDGSRHLPEPSMKPRWLEMARRHGELRGQERRLAELINTEVRALRGVQRRLAPRMKDTEEALDGINTRLEGEPLSEITDELDRQKAIDANNEARRSLNELLSYRYSASKSDVYSQDHLRHAVARAGQRLDSQLSILQTTSPIIYKASVEPHIGSRRELLTSLVEIDSRMTDVNDRLVSLREETRLTQDRLLKLATSSEQDQWRLIGSTRVSITQRRTSSGALILFCLVMGVLFVAGLAFFVMRSVTSSIGKLVRVSRRLRKGDLDVRVEITGRDELQELGSSFNTMAQYLQSRRTRQNDYNEIVTILNTTIGLQETLEASLGDMIERTGSDLGCIYLFEPEEGALMLAHAHALSADDMGQMRIALGEGVVGQVGQNRRLAYVHPVPEGLFELNTGIGRAPNACLLALPLVHLDALLGVIVLGSTRVYSMEEVTFIEEVVFQLSVAISNARFYQTVEATAKVLRVANDKLVQQQKELEEANIQLAEANRLKSEFLANVTHELRTPLNSIMGYTELVMETAELTARQRKNLGTVMRNAENLFRLISDLLDISKMESSKVTLSLEEFDLRALVEESVEMTSPLVSGKALKVRADLPDSPIEFFSDRMKCKQILVNLLSNAIKFTETGSVVVTVEPQASYVDIHVRDSGIGIRSEDLKVIFEKFRQLDGSESRKYGGAGLGLAITRKLCDFLKGSVSAASVPGEGSTFTVRLPVDLREPIEESSEGRPEGGDSRAQPEASRPFVLVIDDDPTTVVNLREGLSGGGLEVRTAFTGRDAVDILREFKPVGVVIGATLPEGGEARSMLEVWNLIKEHRLVVMLVWDGEGEMPTYGYPSDSNPDEELTTAKMARVVGCVSRPVRAEDVLSCLEVVGLTPDNIAPESRS